MNDANVVANFYGTDAQPEEITLITSDRMQWSLEIGRSGEYGLYGQIVEVQPLQQYQLSVIVQRQGYLHMPALRIEWLDADYQVLPALLMEYEIKGFKDGLIKMPAVAVPEGAAYAVPTVYKDKTSGTMTISALAFSDTNCL